MEFSGSGRGQSNVHGNNNNNGGTIMGWDAWELNNTNPIPIPSSTAATSSGFYEFPPAIPHAPPSHAHLVCLKLGKRDYFEDHAQRMAAGRKKGKGVADVVYGSAVPRCQVEGCHVALVNAKDYHRRHKVCEAHSKAPKVSVLGLEQRFCQQCSRFHVVSEFEEAKRSCKRRLAGHNERRRKGSHESITRNSSFLENNKMVTFGGEFPYMYGRNSAHSLLSSNQAATWDTTSELASRSSEALQELIAETRARQLEAGPGHYPGHVTLDFMQAPGPGPIFGFVPPGSRPPSASHVTKDEYEESCDLWNSF